MNFTTPAIETSQFLRKKMSFSDNNFENSFHKNNLNSPIMSPFIKTKIGLSGSE